MYATKLFLLSSLLVLASASSGDDDMPPPFYRVLSVQSPMLRGNDVYIMQNLLLRSPFVKSLQTDSIYGQSSAAAVAAFQSGNQITGVQPGVFDSDTANMLLSLHSCDGYSDPGVPAGKLGYKYRLHFQVFEDRNYETQGLLLNADNVVLHEFTARLHGHATTGDNTWPDFTEDEGLNMFSSDGNTPTGFLEVDLNSPEPDPQLYGPYPVNRFVNGIYGNAQFLMSPNAPIRSGILLHTGNWTNWNPDERMPNSAGCIHAHPDDIKAIWQLLTTKCGVEVRNNPYGQVPYPYQPQGIASIVQVECQ